LNGKDRNMPTLSQKADAALSMMERYQVAHVTMAASAEMIVDMLVDGTFNAAQALSALAEHVAQYRLRLARIDAARTPAVCA
jgi:hypothetical protein